VLFPPSALAPQKANARFINLIVLSLGVTMKASRLSTVLTSIALCLGATTASAELARVGPSNVPSPPGHGFPLWYQDTSGLVLDICNPTTQAQVTPCLLAPAPGAPPPTLPFIFPTNWPDEQFWYAWGASQTLAFPNGQGILVEGAIEAAFATGGAAAGQQISFSRIRIRFVVPVDGTYTVTHPAGVDVFPDQVAGNRLFFTEDVGVAPGAFTGALAGRNGPFLRPVTRNAATGVEAPIPPVTIDGRRFLTDGATDVQVTGSAAGTNYAEVCTDNPGGLDGNPATLNDSCVRTDRFTVIGMLHEGNIPSPMTIERATYRRDAASSQVDVFANAVAGIGQPQASLSFKGTTADVAGLPQPVDCAAVPAAFPSVTMSGPNLPAIGDFYGQAVAAVPLFVTVTNNGDTPATCVSARVVDEVNIVSAVYDAATQTLTVQATSSDKVTPPALTLGGLPGGANAPMAPLGGTDPTLSEGVITNVTVPLPNVTVRSAFGGVDTEKVTTVLATAPPPANQAPVATNDAYVTAEDTVLTVPIAQGVLANDTDAEGDTPTAVKVTDPLSGTVALAADGSFVFTPALNFSGPVTFTYVARQTTPNLANSNTATVQILVTPVNDPPVANPDTGATTSTPTSGTPVAINVTANDTDADGNALTVAAAGPVSPANAGSVTFAGGSVTFTPTNGFAGTASFPYTASDGQGGSATSTVTVNVVAAPNEVIAINQAEFRRTAARWRINGTDTVLAGQTLNLDLVQPTGAVLPIGTASVDAAGAWVFDQTGVNVVPLAGARVRATSQLTGATQNRLVTIRN
jgi:hypothetical protein